MTRSKGSQDVPYETFALIKPFEKSGSGACCPLNVGSAPLLVRLRLLYNWIENNKDGIVSVAMHELRDERQKHARHCGQGVPHPRTFGLA